MQSPETAAAPAAATPTNPWGLVGWFKTPGELFHACEKLRDAGFTKFDAHTPFPVHGLEKAMGAKASKLPWIVLACGIFGLINGVGMQWWMSAVDYPLNISGKPFFAWQFSVPIDFELTVLLSAFGCFFGLWALNGQGVSYFHPTMQHPSFERATDDRFFISVEAKDPKYDAAATRQMLEAAGAQELTEVTP